MDTYKIKWTRLQMEIFRFICINNGQSFNLRAIAKSLHVSPTAVSGAIPNLEKDGLIKVEKSKKINLVSVSFNRENENAINMKRIENLKLIYESRLDKSLKEEFPGCTIILFGSHSRGEDVWFGERDDRNSDVDIAIIGAKDKIIDLLIFEKYLMRDVNVNFYSSWEKIHKNLKNNILSGIILSGGVEL